MKDKIRWTMFALLAVGVIGFFWWLGSLPGPTPEERQATIQKLWGEDLASLQRGDLILVNWGDRESVLIVHHVSYEMLTRRPGNSLVENWTADMLKPMIIKVIRRSDREEWDKLAIKAIEDLAGLNDEPGPTGK